MGSRKIQSCMIALTLAAGLALTSGCARAITDGVSVGISDGLSGGIAQVIEDLIVALDGSAAE